MASAAMLRRIGVVGAGQMGAGIVLLAAQHSLLDRVLLFDSQISVSHAALGFASKHLSRSVEKGRISQAEREAALARVEIAHTLEELASQCDFVIEAATEAPEIKKNIFDTLDKEAPPGTILATNTSSVSVTSIASFTERPTKVIGMHFFNPVPVMKLVEVVPGMATSDDTLRITVELAELLGKTVARSNDSPGFISNRLLMPYINEAVLALSEGIGTKEDIDTIMRLGTAVPMGPLTLADFIGLDTCLAILRVLHTDLGLDKYAPAPLLVRHVYAGWLGKKSGRGFYVYDDDGNKME